MVFKNSCCNNSQHCLFQALALSAFPVLYFILESLGSCGDLVSWTCSYFLIGCRGYHNFWIKSDREDDDDDGKIQLILECFQGGETLMTSFMVKLMN